MFTGSTEWLALHFAELSLKLDWANSRLKALEATMGKIVSVDQDLLDQAKAQADSNATAFAALQTRIAALGQQPAIQADPAATAELQSIIDEATVLGTGIGTAAQPVATQPAPTPAPAPAP